MTEYLTIRDVFTQLGVGEWVVRRTISRGELNAVYVSRKIFPKERWNGMPTQVMAVHKDEFERYLREKREAADFLDRSFLEPGDYLEKQA